MGRTTSSLRSMVKEYVERIRRTAESLPPDEKLVVEKFLEDIETTLSIAMHVGVVDPLEVFLLHLVRRLRTLCSQNY
ncbi:MAG: hypothetical protein QXS14_06035 [Desulfurococcaceae archaeon]